MPGDGTSIGGANAYASRTLYSHSPNNNRATVLKIIVVVSGIAIFWGLGATSSLVPQIFATTQAQIISTSVFASAGMFVGIVGFSIIATTAWDKRPTQYDRLTLNTQAAFKDHGVEVAKADLTVNPRAPSLRIAYTRYAIRGKRDEMEDCSFCKDLPMGMGKLAGVVDGHGGKWVAQLVVDQFPTLFSQKLTECKNVEQAFRETSFKIQELAKEPDIARQKKLVAQLGKKSGAAIYREHCATTKDMPVSTGAVASIVYIDNHNRAFIFTLGDTWTFGFEKKAADTFQTYPLSPDFSHPRFGETRRVRIMHLSLTKIRHIPVHVEALEASEVESKSLRAPLCTANTFRAWESLDDPVMSQEPVVTWVQLNPNRILVIGCDGVWDEGVLDPKDYISKVIQSNWDSPGKIAKETVMYAKEQGSNDNISALVLWVRR